MQKGTWEYLRAVLVLVSFSALFFFSAWWMKGALTPKGAASVGEAAIVWILDAGHGGEDGGAVGVDGTMEKDLNLAVVRCLGEMLERAGEQVIYTRRDDRMTYTEEQNIPGKRKMYDLRNRLAAANDRPGTVLVSIHMNKFPVEKYSGLQVFYGRNDPASRRLAETIQTTVAATLQPDNARQIKPTTDAIYLLWNATGPAVLVECGFLSNPEECKKLSDADYERRLSFSLFCAMMKYRSEKDGENQA